MKPFLIFCLIAFGASSPAPQYSGQTSDLSEKDIETVKDIFGDAGIYGGEQTGKINDGGDIYGGGEQTGKLNEDGYVAPDDYQEPQTADQTKTTNNVDNVFENCSDYENQGYYCVPYYQCEDGIIVTDGAGLIDIRNGFGILSPEDSKCQGFLDVCCLDPDFEAPPPEPVVKHIPKCGTRHQNGLGVRIQGFNEGESQFGEWPHMCAVLTEEPIADAGPGYSGDESETVNLYQCGGSLIAPGVILTAAHCLNTVPDTASIKVRCGEWDTQNQNEPRDHQDRYAVKKDIHPAFNPRNLANDWALLYLESPFELQEHIDTVCLPQPGELFTGTECFATGWGKDKFGSQGEYQVVLKEIDLPVVGHDQCQANLRDTRLGKRFKLDESFICAGGEGYKDTCKGDGGSPLVCPSKYEPNTYVQAGIVAWGIGCGEDNVPGVYASVAQAVCWIDMSMTCNSGSTSSYWGYGEECDSWFINQNSRLNEDLARMQDTTLKGRKKIEALVNGQKAQKVLDYFNGCPVDWAPAAQLVNGGDGYVDNGEIIDISTNERDNYPAQPFTDGTDGVYSDSKTVDTNPSVPLTDGSYPNEPLTDGSYPSEPLTDGSYPSEPLTDGSYPDQLPVDPHSTAPLTSDDPYSEPKTGDQTDGSYAEDSSPVKIVDGTYTEDTADLTGEVKATGPY